MSHTVSVFGLDAEGRTRVLIDYEAGVDAVVKEIRALLAVATGGARLLRRFTAPPGSPPGITLESGGGP